MTEKTLYRGRFSVAPMLDWTTRHCRYFHRQFSQYALLYTEMVTTGAILYGKYDHLLFSPKEQPVALQLGGSDKKALAQCAKMAEVRGFSEINLNVGCPSDRVQNGTFGACLMANAPLVADCVKAMQDVVNIPVTVKTRIGIDSLDSYEFLTDFIHTIAQSGCQEWIIHARKAWLSGLSPKENRDIPPLDYERVYKLKKDFPHLRFVINGGIKTIAEMKTHLQHVDGVMVGREAYQNPALLGWVDNALFDENSPIVSPLTAVEKMLPYIEENLTRGVRLHHMTNCLLGAFQHCKGAKQYRRHISENAHKANADIKVIEDALNFIR